MAERTITAPAPIAIFFQVLIASPYPSLSRVHPRGDSQTWAGPRPPGTAACTLLHTTVPDQKFPVVGTAGTARNAVDLPTRSRLYRAGLAGVVKGRSELSS